MSYFSPREILYFTAATLLLALAAYLFLYSDKSFDDALVNIFSDSIFAIFIVWFVDYANSKDRERRNRANRRILARSVYRFHHSINSVIQGLINDGVASSKSPSVPTPLLVRLSAKRMGSESEVKFGLGDQPIPYAAFYVLNFTGASDAPVYPRRTTKEWLAQNSVEIDRRYTEIVRINDGSLPDEVLDALEELSNNGVVAFTRIPKDHNVSFGYWPEKDLGNLVRNLNTLSKYFSPILGLEKSFPTKEIRLLLESALKRKNDANSQTQE